MGGDVLGGCGIIAASTEFVVDHLELKYTAQNVCVDSGRICDSCICPLIADPVCGCNGFSYINYCYAQSAGVTSWSAGACTTTAIKESSGQVMELLLFPVPAKNVLNVQYELLHSGHSEIKICNILGQAVTKQNIADAAGIHQTQIALNGFAKGIYLIELISGTDRVVKRFVVE